MNQPRQRRAPFLFIALSFLAAALVPAAAHAASISATPNPCAIAASGNPCSTTVSYNEGTGKQGMVTLSIDGGAEGGAVSCGSGPMTFSVNYIGEGHNYLFRLYAGNGACGRAGGALSSVSVSGAPVGNPVPGISLLGVSPVSANAGGPSLSVSIVGSNFIASSVVRWNGTALATNYIGPNQLSATIPSALLVLGSYPITVFNPAPGGGTSYATYFNVAAAAPQVPAITSAGSATGAQGVYFSYQIQATNNPQGYFSSTALPAGLSLNSKTGLISGTPQNSGNYALTLGAYNASGNGYGGLNLTINGNNPGPVLNGISPNAAAQGSPGFNMLVTGSNFINGSAVRWNSTPLSTSFMTATQLNAFIPAANLATAGPVSISVVNPAPGGGTSGAQTFTVSGSVNSPALAITSADLMDAQSHKLTSPLAPGTKAVNVIVTTNLSATCKLSGQYGTGSLTNSDPTSMWLTLNGLKDGFSDVYTLACQSNINASTDSRTLSLAVGVAPPSASTQSVTTPFNTPAAIRLQGTDPNGMALTYAVTTPPLHGVLTGTAPNLTYTPATNYSGSDVLAFTVNNGFVTSLPATVVMTVSAAAAAGYDCELIAKFVAPAVQQIQAELPLSTMKLAAPQNSNLRALFRGMTVRPAFPDRVKTMITTGKSDQQMSMAVNNRYALRSSRHAGPPHFPELSRIYQVYQNVASAQTCQSTLASLQSDPQVEYAQLDKSYALNFTPNDPYWSSTGSWGKPYADLWGLKKVQADNAWDASQGQGVLVAVVDSGVDYNHPDLAGNMWINPATGKPGYDFAGALGSFLGDDDPMDPEGHGTHLAGTIAATGNNGLGIIGLAPQASIMAVKVFDDTGAGRSSYAARGITFAADNGAQVMNMSFGSPGVDPALADALDYAYNQGVVLVAAAGNDAQDALTVFPAASPDVITVSAFDANDKAASFSNFGPKIDVAAPGVDVLSLRAAGTDMYVGSPNYVPGARIVGANYYRADGTSMAAPHVTALAALVLAANPTFTNEQVRSVIRNSADDVDAAGIDPKSGYGRINAARAVQAQGAVAAHILTPAAGAKQTVDFPITGTVQGGAIFSNYSLEVGYGATPSTWTLITTGQKEITNGALGSVPTGNFPDGAITVRLTVNGKNGETAVDSVSYNLQRNALLFPAMPNVPTAAQTIRGGSNALFCALVGGHPTLKLEWAPGIAATTGWSSAATSVDSQGICQAHAVWDTTAVKNAGYFTLRLTLTFPQITTTMTSLIYVEPDLASTDWPQVLDSGNTSGPLPVNDGQGHARLLFSGSAQLGLASTDGSPLQTLSLSGPEIPAVGEVSAASAGDEIVKMDNASVVILSGTGQTLKRFSHPQLQAADMITIAEDFLGAGAPAILVKGRGGSANGLFAFRPDGSLVSNQFPLAITPNSVNALAVDIEGSGKKSLVIPVFDSGNPLALKLYAADGTPQKWGGQKDRIDLPADEIPAQLAAADLDGSGSMNIIIYDRTPSGDFRITVLNADGGIKPGWPQTLHSSDPNGQARLALGDLDHNGRTEMIAIAGNTLAVFRPDGTPYAGWPHADPKLAYGNLAIGDVNGDGEADILVTGVQTVSNPFSDPKVPFYYNAQSLFAFNKNGSLIKSWQLQGAHGMGGGWGARPLIGDFDHSGFVQIALADFLTTTITSGLNSSLYFWTAGNESALTVLKLNAPYNANKILWASAYRDPQNTSILPSATAASPLTACQKTIECGQGHYCDGTGYCAATPAVSVSISTPMAANAVFTIGDTVSFAGKSAGTDSALLGKIGLVIALDATPVCSGQGYTCDTSRAGAVPGSHLFLAVEAGTHTLSATAYIADKSGALVSVGQSAGFALTVVPPPQKPQLSALPKIISLDDSLQVADQGYSTRYTWSFTPAGGIAPAAAALSARASSGPNARSLSTSQATLSLRALGLPPGDYELQVAAVSLAGRTSAPASAFVTLVAANTPHVVVYPNPWRADLHAGKPITFTAVPTGGELKIFTVSGQWVATRPESGGQAQWDRTNSRGDLVQSGLYIYLITDAQGGQSRGKFVIIR